jgi:hypothetical protein
MGLYVILEGTSSYNEDVQPNISEEDFKKFDAMMDSDEPFNLDSEDPKQSGENIEKKVKDAEKKMIASCKNHIESSEPTKSLPFL